MVEWRDKFPETEREKIVLAAKASLRKPEGQSALDYLLNVRKFSNETINKFNIGYCPTSINHQVKGRIITPIYDTYGNLVAISTRHLDRSVKNRFWHESFDKGSYLYGLYYAKNKIRKINKVLIVEGECDVACYHSYGFDMTVGLCGSAFTLFQVSLLIKYCTDFYFMFDGDVAGKTSMERAIRDYEKYNLKNYQLRFIPVILPKGRDPDDYLIENGREGVKEKLKTAKENYEFKF
jgi:DNA primase